PWRIPDIEKKKGKEEGLPTLWSAGLSYASLLRFRRARYACRRRQKPSPAKPDPRSSKEAGSGTAASAAAFQSGLDAIECATPMSTEAVLKLTGIFPSNVIVKPDRSPPFASDAEATLVCATQSVPISTNVQPVGAVPLPSKLVLSVMWNELRLPVKLELLG